MKKLLLLLIALFHGPGAWAFPELVRHGYTHCTACHVSPSGGGVLSAYGRELSKELLSMWGREGEQRVLHGAIRDDEFSSRLLLGGDIRAIQLYRDDPMVREAQYFLMQADLEAALKLGPWTLAGTLGKLEAPGDSSVGSRRFFAMVSLSDESSLRMGKFLPAFGLNIADHSRSTRGSLGFGQGQESYNLEYSWLGEKWSFYSTAILAPSDAYRRTTGRDAAFSQQMNYALNSSGKLGMSYLLGSGGGLKTHLLGVHWMQGFLERFHLLAEADASFSRDRRAWFRFARLGYELTQGLQLLALHDGSVQAGFEKSSWGVGAQWFPRPHLEIQAQWNRVPDDLLFLVLHYYL